MDGHNQTVIAPDMLVISTLSLDHHNNVCVGRLGKCGELISAFYPLRVQSTCTLGHFENTLGLYNQVATIV